jgi:4-hydroxy-tetrahydrodipicolinate synthase
MGSVFKGQASGKAKVKFEGIYTPAVTPFTAAGDIDRKAFVAVLESLIQAGVHGIIVGGSTGEYYAHTADERDALATLAKDVTKNRAALIVGTGATRTEDSVAYARHAKEIGADAILVSSPPYALPTERENAVHALTVDRAANLPIMLYNYPGRTGVMMGEAFLSRALDELAAAFEHGHQRQQGLHDGVSRSRNFQAIKESSGDINRVHLLARDFPHIAMCSLGRKLDPPQTQLFEPQAKNSSA